jgi:glycosyltransferase involved in cell wall biosynthesis
MARIRPKVTVFGWPSHLGGADTKLAHLLRLLHKDVEFTVVPNEKHHLDGPFWPNFLKNLGIHCCLLDQLPHRRDGFALSLSNQCFFTHHICHRAKDRGLKVVWSSEMMWHHEGELDAVRDGLIDRVLYTSKIQKDLLGPNYGKIPGFITGNYIDPVQFPFAERRRAGFTIGRLSRPAPEKYPEDFPVFYECLELPECRFRVMAWDEKLASKYRWHRFDHRWDLLAAETEDTAQFLNSLDLFVYPLGHFFTESWGRSTVEAMLTGAIPLVPPGHHLDELIVHGKTGYICNDFREYQEWAKRLFFDYPTRQAMARQCHDHAVNNLCNAEQHRHAWLEAFQ